MKPVVFAGTLKELNYEKSGAKECLMKFVPDTEYTVARECDLGTPKCAVFQPTQKKQFGFVFIINDKLVVRCKLKTPMSLLVGGHYEFEIERGASNSMFDFTIDGVPPSRGKFSVTKISAL